MSVIKIFDIVKISKNSPNITMDVGSYLMCIYCFENSLNTFHKLEFAVKGEKIP
ncbi:hypothetical protein Tfer_1410 [Thermincola ferriacetica]|uniref:Uncharacterized protein n=1 Tax=Thermincola ferriacetica TaxID=281456 RepID=A0A0L6W2N3_9FIRM|nr:hypothetical protein Tfer_1410 [Thermincola ferriacetica]